MLSLTSACVLWLLVCLVEREVQSRSFRLGGLPDQSSNPVDVIMKQVVEHHLPRCHLVLATSENQNEVFYSLLRDMVDAGKGVTVVETSLAFSQELPMLHHVLHRLWGDSTITCRVLLLFVDDVNKKSIFRFLEASKVWLLPDTPTVVVGRRSDMKGIFHHVSLRNTISLLYITSANLSHHQQPYNGSEHVRVYRRCLYCKNGGMGVVLERDPTSSKTQELENLMGHTVKIVALGYFPFAAYKRNDDDPDALSIPVDSLDTRVLNSISANLNFTYEMREPSDGLWGVPLEGGNWSGIVGTLQHHKADFSLNLTPSVERMKAIAFSIIYSYDPLLIVSLKPGTLPRHLALLRPFSDDLWIMIIVFTFVCGIAFGLLQKIWSKASGLQALRLDSSLFYIWGVLLEDPPSSPPSNTSGQVFVGCWWLSCLIIQIGYRSSLIAHLSVQSRYQPMNSFEDLLSRDGWTWGSHSLGGTSFLHFNQSSDPVTQEIYKHLQTYDRKDGVERVLEGGFSYITWRAYSKIETASHHNDNRVNKVFHISTKEYPVLGGNSWGFRKGAPFLSKIRKMKRHLVEAGLMDHWTDDVINSEVKKRRAKRNNEEKATHNKKGHKTPETEAGAAMSHRQLLIDIRED